MKPLPASARLSFREYRPGDLDALAEVFADEAARRFYPEHGRPEKLRAWIDWNLRNYEQHGFGLWVIEQADSGRFAGDAGLTLQPVEGEQVLEIGYHLHRQLRGQGLATEAARACLAWAFEHTRHDMVCSIVDPANEPSIAVARRVHRDERRFMGRSGERLLFYTRRER